MQSPYNFIARTLRALKWPQNAPAERFSIPTAASPSGGDKKRVSARLEAQMPLRVVMEQEQFRLAVEQAKMAQNPDRAMLQRYYQEAMKDLELQSLIRTANFSVLSQPWAIVTTAGAINQNVTDLLERQWFADLMEAFLNAEYFGTTVAELGPFTLRNNVTEISQLNILERAYFQPETGLLRLSESAQFSIPYRQPPVANYLVEMGDLDLGSLQYLVRMSIYKGYSLTDWARSMERWGDPIMVLFSDSYDQSELARKAEFAKNFGKNSYAVLQSDDKVELLERNQTNPQAIFLEFLKYVDDQLNKGVNGQTGTSSEKSFTGAAEVHERILDKYTEARMRRLQYFLNETVLERLAALAGGQTAYRALIGHQFAFLDLRRNQATKAEPKQKNQPVSPNALGKSPAPAPSYLQALGLNY